MMRRTQTLRCDRVETLSTASRNGTQWNGSLPFRLAEDRWIGTLRAHEILAGLVLCSTDRLSVTNRWDLRLLRANIAKLRWGFETQRTHFRNPMTYAGALDVLIYFT